MGPGKRRGICRGIGSSPIPDCCGSIPALALCLALLTEPPRCMSLSIIGFGSGIMLFCLAP